MRDVFGVTLEAVNDSAAMALNGATLQMFNHGIITGALFLLVGVIYERAHTRELAKFGGLATVTPYFYGMMMVAAFASLGLPGLAGFWAGSSPSARRLPWFRCGRRSVRLASS